MHTSRLSRNVTLKLLHILTMLFSVCPPFSNQRRNVLACLRVIVGNDRRRNANYPQQQRAYHASTVFARSAVEQDTGFTFGKRTKYDADTILKCAQINAVEFTQMAVGDSTRKVTGKQRQMQIANALRLRKDVRVITNFAIITQIDHRSYTIVQQVLLTNWRNLVKIARPNQGAPPSDAPITGRIPTQIADIVTAFDFNVTHPIRHSAPFCQNKKREDDVQCSALDSPRLVDL